MKQTSGDSSCIIPPESSLEKPSSVMILHGYPSPETESQTGARPFCNKASPFQLGMTTLIFARRRLILLTDSRENRDQAPNAQAFGPSKRRRNASSSLRSSQGI